MAFQKRSLSFRVHSALSLTIGGALVLATPSAAWASAGFPSYLIDNYGWAGSPTECTLCHTSSPGISGTAVRPFATALKARGLAGGGNTAALDTAIDMLGATDSDGDSATDVDELTQEGDPNDPSTKPGGFEASEPVEYGCVGGTIAGRTDGDSRVAVVAAAFVAAALVWSRRRRG
jgi:hypothetical protein